MSTGDKTARRPGGGLLLSLVVAAASSFVLARIIAIGARERLVPADAGRRDEKRLGPGGEAGGGSAERTGFQPSGSADTSELAPGDEGEEHASVLRSVALYFIGLCLAALLTAASFFLPSMGLVWGPNLAVTLSVLAIAQMGVHLVFFLHIDTSPDSTNNILALAFGILIVFLLVAGSLWIMAHMNTMMPDHGSTHGHH